MKVNNLRSTSYLTIHKLDEQSFIAWTPNYLGLFVPKLIYELHTDGQILKIRIIGFLKVLFLNWLIYCGMISLVVYFLDNSIEQLISAYPFFLGIFVFLILLNYIVIFSTRWKVEQQFNNNSH